jgi:hypothetical protein
MRCDRPILWRWIRRILTVCFPVGIDSQRHYQAGRGPDDLLSDERWDDSRFCNGRDLGHLVQSCRYFYVAGHQPERWRDLCSSKEATLSLPQALGKIPTSSYFIQMGNINRMCRYLSVVSIPITTTACTPADPLRYLPLGSQLSQVLSIASQSSDMTNERFFGELRKPNRPVVVEGAASVGL